ncbi:MAG: heparinase II/III family protein [Planctomycetes bacterium]|nr:heparinase II/III family protein [Planctomycetota bacterium]
MRIQWPVMLMMVVAAGCARVSAAEEAKGDAAAKPAAFDPGQPTFPDPPRVATTAQELAAMKAAPDAQARRDAAVRAGDILVDNPPPLPEGYGSWVFYYACPDDGSTLQKITLTEHKCPTCGKVYTDDRTNAAYRCLMHADIENASVTLGWAYAWTGDERYAAGVRRILIKLADDYHTYPARLDRWGHTGMFAPLGGRRYVQSLDEAVGVIRLARGYDLTRGSKVWSDADRKHVEQDFFRATADSLTRFTQTSNHQTWFNGGMIAVGATLGDAKLIDRVMTMHDGVLDQIATNVGPDGLWNEGTVAYHNYALQALLATVDITRNLGMHLQDHPTVKRTITGPLSAAYPNGQYPAINDSDPADTGVFAWAFEWGWKTYHDPVLAQAVARGNADRLHAMLGMDAKVEWPPALKSEALTGVGLAILRRGSGAGAACTFLDYGPHGGGHGHYDKLNLMLYADGREWLLDPGRLTYSHKEYKSWVKQTAAHNTVTLGGETQKEDAGKLLWMTENKQWSACATRSTGAYPGATLTRYLALGDGILVDVFDVKAGDKTQIDLLAHAVADRVEPVGAGPAPVAKPITPGDHDGYQHLTEASARTFTRNSTWEFVAGQRRLVTWLLYEPGEQLINCMGIGYNTSQKTPTLIRRRNAKETRFVCVYDLSGDGSVVRGVKAREVNGNIRVEVAIPKGLRIVTFGPEGLVAQ